MQTSNVKRNLTSLMAMYFVMQMFLAPQYGYLSIYYQERGLSTDQIGLLYGLSPFISILGQYILGGIADKAKSVNRVYLFTAIVSLSLVPLFLFTHSFIPIMVVSVTYNVFSHALSPLSDSICIYYATENGGSYGRIRMMGSIGYMFCMLACGYFCDINVDYMLFMQMGLGVLFILTIRITPKVTMPKMKKATFNPLVMLKKPSVLMTFLLMAPIYASFGYCTAFFGPYVTGELGLNSSFISYATFISIIIEVSSLLLLDKLLKRFNVKALLFFVSSLVCIRWLVYGLSDEPLLLLLFFGFEGISVVMTSSVVAFYFKRIAPPEGKASTQTMISIFGSCLCKGIGSLSASTVLNIMGSHQNAYLFFAIVCIASTLIFGLTPVRFKSEEVA